MTVIGYFLPELTVEFTDADIGITAEIIPDRLQFLLGMCIGMLSVGSVGFWFERFPCSIVCVVPAHERRFGDMVSAAYKADIFSLTI